MDYYSVSVLRNLLPQHHPESRPLRNYIHIVWSVVAIQSQELRREFVGNAWRSLREWKIRSTRQRELVRFRRETVAPVCVTKRGDEIEDNQCANIYSPIRNKLTRKLGNPITIARWSRANTFMYVFAERFRSREKLQLEKETNDTCPPEESLNAQSGSSSSRSPKPRH